MREAAKSAFDQLIRRPRRACPGADQVAKELHLIEVEVVSLTSALGSVELVLEPVQEVGSRDSISSAGLACLCGTGVGDRGRCGPLVRVAWNASDLHHALWTTFVVQALPAGSRHCHFGARVPVPGCWEVSQPGLLSCLVWCR